MTSHILTILVGLLLSAGIGFTLAGYYTYRKYSETIGSASFAGFVISHGIVITTESAKGAISLAYEGPFSSGFETNNIPAELILPPWLETAYLMLILMANMGVIAGPIFWTIFVFRYTSRFKFSKKFIIGIVSVLVPFWILLSLVNITELGDPINSLLSFIQLINSIIIFGLVGAGVLQLYRTAQRYPLLDVSTVSVVSGAFFVPVLSSSFVAFTDPGELAGTSIRFTGILFALGSIWAAVEHYGIFDQLPVSQTVGRKTAVESIDSAVIVLGANRVITDLNEMATKLFAVTRDDLPTSLAALLPEPVSADAIWKSGRTEFSVPDSEKIIEAETTVTTDEDGTELGRTVIFRDVTEQRRRQQRVEVLNRVLRHNLRNELNVVSGYSQLLTDGGVETETCANKIDSQVTDLLALGETAQEIETILNADSTIDPPTELRSLVEPTVETVSASTPGSITMNIPPEIAVRANPTILQPVIQELLENAIKHTDCDRPEVNIMTQDGGRTIVITDNGPGIPAHEIEVLEAGEETALEHGSGLGLWLVNWGVDRLGGDIQFDTEWSGTRVSIHLPEQLVSP